MEHTPRIRTATLHSFCLEHLPPHLSICRKNHLAFIELHALFEVQFILGRGTGKQPRPVWDSYGKASAGTASGIQKDSNSNMQPCVYSSCFRTKQPQNGRHSYSKIVIPPHVNISKWYKYTTNGIIFWVLASPVLIPKPCTLWQTSATWKVMKTIHLLNTLLQVMSRNVTYTPIYCSFNERMMILEHFLQYFTQLKYSYFGVVTHPTSHRCTEVSVRPLRFIPRIDWWSMKTGAIPVSNKSSISQHSN